MLAKRTEGWVAGLCLSALQMEGSSDPERLVTDLAMDRGSIGEYLMEEVLSAQPYPVQEVLDPVQHLRPDLGSAGGRHL